MGGGRDKYSETQGYLVPCTSCFLNFVGTWLMVNTHIKPTNLYQVFCFEKQIVFSSHYCCWHTLCTTIMCRKGGGNSNCLCAWQKAGILCYYSCWRYSSVGTDNRQRPRRSTASNNCRPDDQLTNRRYRLPNFNGLEWEWQWTPVGRLRWQSSVLLVDYCLSGRSPCRLSAVGNVGENAI